MKTSMRNLLLNFAAIGLLVLFLVWAETNLDGYKVQILNLIAVNAILALSLNLIYGFTGMFSPRARRVHGHRGLRFRPVRAPRRPEGNDVDP